MVQSVVSYCEPYRGAIVDRTGTLGERLGGERAVRKIVADFVAGAGADPKVDLTRGGKFLKTPGSSDVITEELVRLISSLSGGPYDYKGRSMKDTHKGMGITDEQFDAAAGHMKAALEKNRVKAEDVRA